MNEKKVSVWCLTYNHKDYICDTLEGFIKQKTDFKYEVFVYDDASVDGTSEILRNYKNKYPKLFNIYISEKNRWKDIERRKFIYDLRIRNQNSKYIACCEGDDYWIDEEKLQIQVDYMEAHPECSMYIHNCEWLNCEDNTTKLGNPFDGDGEWDIPVEQLIMQSNGHPATASFLFRRELLLKDFFFFDAPVGDYTLLLCAAAHGKIHYNSKPMSVYRWKSQGSYSVRISAENVFYDYYCMGIVNFLVQYNCYTHKKYEKIISEKLKGWLNYLVRKCKKENIQINELYENCRKNGYFLSESCKSIFPKLQEMISFEDVTFLSEETKQFIRKYEHIFIMGAGTYAQFLTDKLEFFGISFDGYVVSNPTDNKNSFNGKRVYSLEEIPFQNDQFGVVVGILIKGKNDIIESLEKAGIRNYYFPFEYNLFR